MPARLRDLLAALQDFGIDHEMPKKGSHWKLRRAGSRPYPLTAHNGLRSEIPDEYIQGACRHFGIERELLLKRLREG